MRRITLREILIQIADGEGVHLTNQLYKKLIDDGLVELEVGIGLVVTWKGIRIICG